MCYHRRPELAPPELAPVLNCHVTENGQLPVLDMIVPATLAVYVVSGSSAACGAMTTLSESRQPQHGKLKSDGPAGSALESRAVMATREPSAVSDAELRCVSASPCCHHGPLKLTDSG